MGVGGEELRMGGECECDIWDRLVGSKRRGRLREVDLGSGMALFIGYKSLIRLIHLTIIYLAKLHCLERICPKSLYCNVRNGRLHIFESPSKK